MSAGRDIVDEERRGPTAAPFTRALWSGLLSSSLWAGAARVAGVLSFLGTTLLAARFCSEQDFAGFVLVSTLVFVLSPLVVLGFNRIAIRATRERLTESDPAGAVRVQRLCLLTSTAVGCVVACAYALVVRLLPGSEIQSSLEATAWPTALWLLVAGVNQLLAELLRAVDRVGASAGLGGQQGSAIVNVLVLVSLAVSANNATTTLNLLVWQYVVANLVVGLPMMVYLTRVHRSLLGPGSPTTKRAPGEAMSTVLSLLRQGAPIVGVAVCAAGMQYVDILLLGAIGSSEELAAYGAVRRLMMFVLAPLLVLNVALPPFISDLHVAGRSTELERLLRTTATAAALPGLALLIVLALFPDASLTLLFGPKYAGNEGVVRPLSIGYIATLGAGSGHLALVMTQYERTCLLISIGLGIAYIVVAPAAVRAYGVEGAAVTTGGLYVVNSLATTVLVRRRLSIWPTVYANPFTFLGTARSVFSTWRSDAGEPGVPSDHVSRRTGPQSETEPGRLNSQR